MSREALVLLVCCCDFRDGAERLIPSKSLRNAVIRAFPGLFRILRMCAPRRAAAVVRPRGREKSADRRRRILISRLLIIHTSVPRRKSPFPAYFKGFPAVSPLIPPYPAFLKYPVSPQWRCIDNRTSAEIFRQEVRFLGVSMLPFFNQKELVVCSNQSQYQKYTSLLEKEGIGYRTKVRDLSSPSLFSMGTRERAGTAFQKVNYQMLYTIYVRKADYERAVHVILA